LSPAGRAILETARARYPVPPAIRSRVRGLRLARSS
jgi:hypothetical protein